MNTKLIGTLFLLGALISPITNYAADTTTDTAGEYVDDATITTRVKVALTGDKKIKSREISVRTDQGVVDLTGKVGNKEESEKATECATKVKGVKAVHNNLKVS